MSGIKLDVRVDVSDLIKKHEALRNNLLKAAARAINATAADVRRTAVKEITTRVGDVPASVVRGYVTIRQAKYKAPRLNRAGQLRSNYAGISATVTAKGKAPNLITFVPAAKRTPTAFRADKGVTAKVMGKQVLYKGAFIVKTKSGKPVVVSRSATASRVKGVWQANWSKGLYGPPMKSLVGNHQTQAAMDAIARIRWPLHWQRESAKVLAAGGVV